MQSHHTNYAICWWSLWLCCRLCCSGKRAGLVSILSWKFNTWCDWFKTLFPKEIKIHKYIRLIIATTWRVNVTLYYRRSKNLFNDSTIHAFLLRKEWTKTFPQISAQFVCGRGQKCKFKIQIQFQMKYHFWY